MQLHWKSGKYQTHKGEAADLVLQDTWCSLLFNAARPQNIEKSTRKQRVLPGRWQIIIF